MNKEELKELIKEKTAAIEAAAEEGRPYAELMKMYKELKELQFKLAHSDAGLEQADTLGS
jgi:hypothetical protein